MKKAVCSIKLMVYNELAQKIFKPMFDSCSVKKIGIKPY